MRFHVSLSGVYFVGNSSSVVLIYILYFLSSKNMVRAMVDLKHV